MLEWITFIVAMQGFIYLVHFGMDRAPWTTFFVSMTAMVSLALIIDPKSRAHIRTWGFVGQSLLLAGVLIFFTLYDAWHRR